MNAIAAYTRHSNEDIELRKGTAEESESISNQRAMIFEYIRQSKELNGARVLEFSDDGWSGKNFERPGFKKMMQLVRQGEIQCIIVKDLSRLGRDYLIVGNYLSRVFPFLNVRFIAINDNYDSIRSTDIDSLDTSFRTLIYDLYSRDLSKKVRSAKLQKAKKGDFLSSHAPFGYKKNPKNKNQLLIDEEAASTVRLIFKRLLDGRTTTQIARELNDTHILTPKLYKIKCGCSKKGWPGVAKNNFWDKGAVTIILRDERYTGKVIYGRKVRKTIGINRTVSTARDNWTVVEGTHEAIISEDIFQKARLCMRKYREHKVIKGDYLLYGKVFCGVCKHAIPRTIINNSYYLCETHKYFSACDCPQERISAEELEGTVLKLIRTQARYAVEVERVMLEQRKKAQVDTDKAKQRMAQMNALKVTLEENNRRLYERFVEGELGKEEYIRQKNNLRQQIDNTVESISVIQSELEGGAQPKNLYIEAFKNYADVEDLTVEMIGKVVDHVYIYPGMKLDIKLNFREELSHIVL